MDFGVIIFILLIIASSIYRRYKEEMAKSTASKDASPVKAGTVTGKKPKDRILQDIISEIERNRSIITGSKVEIETGNHSGLSVPEMIEPEEKVAVVEEKDFTEASSESEMVSEKAPLLFLKDKSRGKTKRGFPSERIKKGIVPDYKDAGSLSTGFIYATVLGDPVCRRSFSRNRKH